MQNALLMIDTPGGILRTRDGMFEYLCNDELSRYAPAKLEQIYLPPKVKLTSEAILLALDNGVEMVFTDRRRDFKGRLWNGRFGSIATIRRNQLHFSESAAGLAWVQSWLADKLEQQWLLLRNLYEEAAPGGAHWSADNISQFYEKAAALRPQQPSGELSSEVMARAFERMRGLEGSLQRTYFQMLSEAMPPGFRFKERSRRPAQDPFNAALNYLYGILYAEVERALLSVGLDPAIGVMHAEEHNRPSMVLDFIEPYRLWADRVLVKLCLRQMLDLEFFSTNKEGVVISSVGRRILAPAFVDYLDEVVAFNNKKRSRREHLHQAAQALATYLKTDPALAEPLSSAHLRAMPQPKQRKTSHKHDGKDRAKHEAKKATGQAEP